VFWLLSDGGSVVGVLGSMRPPGSFGRGGKVGSSGSAGGVDVGVVVTDGSVVVVTRGLRCSG